MKIIIKNIFCHFFNFYERWCLRILILLSMGIISQYSIAITIDLRVYSECAIVDDISDTLLQFHQSGLDLNDVEVVMTELSGFQIHLVDDMIDDLKRMPLFQLISIKEQASDNYKAKWKKHCLEAKAKVSEPQNLK